MKHYDYIFTGTGLAALMTVYKMIVSSKFEDKKILLLDENAKKTNDRTWCFWSQKPTDWNNIVSEKWHSALFKNKDFTKNIELDPYEYCQIRGIDFYNFVFEVISKQKNITFLKEKVTNINELQNHVYVSTENQEFTGAYVMNSILNITELARQSDFPVLQQHFIGWFVKTENAIFHPEQATFMDFSVAQKNNTRFMYVLPISTNEALVEYTLFSKDLLENAEYENSITNYLQSLGATTFQITKKEQGRIPMTCYPFWKKNTKRVVQIGTAGGWTKASTGYTFSKSDKKTNELIDFLLQKKDFKTFIKKDKFWFYDLLLLDILARHNDLGITVFSSMFEKGNARLIFKFLDEETSFFEDLQIILKCPKLPFIKALFRILPSISR